MHKLFALALIVVTLAAFPSGAEAKMRPTVDKDGAMDCFADPDTDSDYPDGVIVSCCYDDGCWICENAAGQNCVWDPKYRVAPLGEVTVKPGILAPKAKIAATTSRLRAAD